MVLESVECTNLLVPLQMTPIRLLPPRRGLDIGAFEVWKYGNQLGLSHTKSKLLNHPAVLFWSIQCSHLAPIWILLWLYIDNAMTKKLPAF